MKPQEELFLRESNLIEGVGEEGLESSKKAYLYLMQVKPPLTLKHILKTHRLLMETLNPKIAGKIRQVPVGIYSGGECIHKCPDPKEINHLMYLFLGKVNIFFPHYKLDEFCQSSHKDFENMHPFEDGNGRTGRMILNWQRKQNSLPPLIIYDKDKQEYYKWFKDNN